MPHGHGGDAHSHSHGGPGLKQPLLDEEHGHAHGRKEEGSGHSHKHGGHDGHGGCCGGGHDHGGRDHGGHDHGGHDHGHGHGHGHGEHEEADDKSKMKRAIMCALFFMCVEIVGGVLANSLAIMTDAAHMLSDVGGFAVSLVALQLADIEATSEFSFGFSQAEVLGALFSVMMVWGLTAVLLYEAVYRFLDPEEIDAPVMFTIACVGFLVNLVLMKVLGHGHSHDHGHSHGEEETGAAMQAAIAHVIGDLVQSLGVCLAALCIWLKPFDVGFAPNGVSRWCYADPCCTVMFGVLVLFTTKSTTARALNTLMARAPKHIDQAVFVKKLEAIPDVDSIHDLHVWSVGSREVCCTAHVMINDVHSCTQVLKGCIQAAQGMGIGHSTFQIEIVGEFDPAEESYGLHKNPSRRELESGGETPAKSRGAGHEHGHSHGHGHGH